MTNQERLDMADLAAACVAAGLHAIDEISFVTLYDGSFREGVASFDGLSESPEIAFALRNAVRHTVDVCRERDLDNMPSVPFEAWWKARQWLSGPLETFSTEGAARTLVALHRAGLLGTVAA